MKTLNATYNDIDLIASKFAKEYNIDVTLLVPSGNILNKKISDIIMSKCKNVEIIDGSICKLTTDEVDDIVMDFSSKFRNYGSEFTTKYFELLRYLEDMDEKRNGYFSRHLIKNKEMRDVLDITFKLD